MPKPIYLIFTIPSTDSFTSLAKTLGLDETNHSTPKAVGYNLSINEFPSVKELDQIDIIFLPEHRGHEKRIEALIPYIDKLYLVIHKGGKKKDKQRRRIETWAGNKLQIPVIESHHASGPVFDVIRQLATVKGDDKAKYETYLEQLSNLFSFDLSQELKLKLYSFCTSALKCQEVIRGELPKQYSHVDFSQILDQTRVKDCITSMAEFTGENIHAFNKLRSTFSKVLFGKN